VLAAATAFAYKGSSMLEGHLERASPEILEEALRRTARELAVRQGPDPARWSWGRLHTQPWRHPIGVAVPLLDRLLSLSRGPFPAGGDNDTPNQSGVNPWRGYESSFAIASYRQLIDAGDWDRCLFILPPGQSGHPGSRHYDDMLEDWRRGHYRPLPYGRAAVEAAAEETIGLVPAA